METDARKIASGGKWRILVGRQKAKRKFRSDPLVAKRVQPCIIRVSWMAKNPDAVE
jgi:hypothetical protein